jgi:hypothetical protein
MAVLFYGAIPTDTIEQITRVIAFAEWGDVYVGCSGSFRFDCAVHEKFPTVRVHSNDMSLLSCSIGALAAGEPFPLSFHGRLAFLEDHLTDAPFIRRVAAVQIAQIMVRFRGKNPFAQSTWNYYLERLPEMLDRQVTRIETFVDRLGITSFHAGDFRDQAARAKESGGGVVAFPPTFKGDFESHYRFVDQNVEWPRPSYGLWDPATMEDWIDSLNERGIRYCVLVERKLDRHTPVTVFRGKIRPVFTYASAAGSSVKRGAPRAAEPFRYVPVDPAKLTRNSRIEIVAANNNQMNFLKDVYLKKEIHDIGGMASYLVLLDGMLAGGFIYVRSKYGQPGLLYVMCDFSLAPKSRLSKLIIMIQTSRTIIRRMEVRMLTRIDRVATTAYSDKPISMKYRGLYELNKRIPATDLTSQALYYVSAVREHSPAEIYKQWWDRFVAPNANHPGKARRPEAGGKERPLHGGEAVRQAGRQPEARRGADQPAAGAS